MTANASKRRIISSVHPSINLTLKRSRALLCAFTAGYLLPLIPLIATDLWWPAKLAIGAALFGGAGFTLREHVWHRVGAIEHIVLRVDGEWRVRRHGCVDTVPARLLPRALVLPWLTILRFEFSAAEQRHAILTTDNVDSQAFRLLRVRLRNQP